MRIAIASGKGGTGKTTVATNLAAILADYGQRVSYVDCDVEAPDGHLFLHPEIVSEKPVLRLIPAIDAERCRHCGACARFCRFNAISSFPKTTLVHRELCHSCGGCILVCPAGAIREEQISVGVVQSGRSGGIAFTSGTFNVGLANSTPVIRAAKEAAGNEGVVLLDSPPGTSCAMIETVKGCDYVIMVTEPTPFGLHDLHIAMEAIQRMDLPFGVVINRSDEGAQDVRNACAKAGAPILAEIPNDRRIARAYSEGILACRALPELRRVFADILTRLAGILAVTDLRHTTLCVELQQSLESAHSGSKKALVP